MLALKLFDRLIRFAYDRFGLHKWVKSTDRVGKTYDFTVAQALL